jgi:hypothetical protein
MAGAPWAAAALIQCYAFGSGRCLGTLYAGNTVRGYLYSNDYCDVIETLPERIGISTTMIAGIGRQRGPGRGIGQRRARGNAF